MHYGCLMGFFVVMLCLRSGGLRVLWYLLSYSYFYFLTPPFSAVFTFLIFTFQFSCLLIFFIFFLHFGFLGFAFFAWYGVSFGVR